MENSRFLLLSTKTIVNTTSKNDQRWFKNWRVEGDRFVYTGANNVVRKIPIIKRAMKLEDLVDGFLFYENGKPKPVDKEWCFNPENQEKIANGDLYGYLQRSDGIDFACWYDVEKAEFVEV